MNRLVLVTVLFGAAIAHADRTGDFCRARNESVADEVREEADERCSHVAAALLDAPSTALGKLTELDVWIAAHQRPAPPPAPVCDDLVEARRRSLLRAVEAKVDAEESALRALDSTQPSAPPRRKKVHRTPMANPF